MLCRWTEDQARTGEEVRNAEKGWLQEVESVLLSLFRQRIHLSFTLAEVGKKSNGFHPRRLTNLATDCSPSIQLEKGPVRLHLVFHQVDNDTFSKDV